MKLASDWPQRNIWFIVNMNKNTQALHEALVLLLRQINAWLLLPLPTLDLICSRELRARLNISSVLPFECVSGVRMKLKFNKYELLDYFI
jgi:hypothetical protein